MDTLRWSSSVITLMFALHVPSATLAIRSSSWHAVTLSRPWDEGRNKSSIHFSTELGCASIALRASAEFYCYQGNVCNFTTAALDYKAEYGSGETELKCKKREMC